PNRRGFLAGIAGATLLSTLEAPGAFAQAGPLSPDQRRNRAFVVRRDAAILQRDRPDEILATDNGDEQLYPNRIASFTKGLPHNQLGEVDGNAYNALLRALRSGSASDFEAILLGAAVKLLN